ncbi:hypothetical protein [Henriciella marina]|jgi:hypothetical protein|uniref:Uncharacterized protein n=1 Tax=Henriciella marina TaxID=453851 RepID=A0ABT4LRY2_9PROT|nr:hypothetical protein [Henriciella marina]MCZ4297124.1 hypothetical protein [Henriciella marina]
MAQSETRLYLIYLRGAREALNPREFAGLRQLDEGLYLLRSDASRSKVYHAIKYAALPDSLLVAPLEDAPKFKGMRDGALKWLRANS